MIFAEKLFLYLLVRGSLNVATKKKIHRMKKEYYIRISSRLYCCFCVVLGTQTVWFNGAVGHQSGFISSTWRSLKLSIIGRDNGSPLYLYSRNLIWYEILRHLMLSISRVLWYWSNKYVRKLALRIFLVSSQGKVVAIHTQTQIRRGDLTIWFSWWWAFHSLGS